MATDYSSQIDSCGVCGEPGGTHSVCSHYTTVGLVHLNCIVIEILPEPSASNSAKAALSCSGGTGIGLAARTDQRRFANASESLIITKPECAQREPRRFQGGWLYCAAAPLVRIHLHVIWQSMLLAPCADMCVVLYILQAACYSSWDGRLLI